MDGAFRAVPLLNARYRLLSPGATLSFCKQALNVIYLGFKTLLFEITLLGERFPNPGAGKPLALHDLGYCVYSP